MAITIARPSPARAAISAVEQLRAGPVEAGEGLVEEQHPRVLDEGAGDQRALALAAGELAEGLPRQRRRGRPARAPRAAASRSAPARAPPPGQPRERAHRRHVEGRDRVVEPRALGLGDGRAAGADPQLAAHRAELAEQRPQQGRLAAAVGAEQRQPLAAAQREGDVGDRLAGAVADREALGLDQRRCGLAQGSAGTRASLR